MRIVLPIAALSLMLAGPVAAATALPGWLAGTWARENGAAWAEELWTAPRHGQMLGLFREGFGPDVNTWAYLRIEADRDGNPMLIMHKSGEAAIRYPLAVASEAAIEFASAGQPYPQRIRYWREGQLLMIEISRMDGGETKRFNYRPVSTFQD